MPALRRFAVRLAGLLALALTPPLAGQADQFREVVQRDSNDARHHYLLGLALVRDEEYDEAAAAFRAALALDSRLADAYLALSYLPYLQRRQLASEEQRGRVPAAWRARLEEAQRLYRRAFIIDPMVNLRPLTVLFPQGRWTGRDFTSDESKFYELFIEGFDDLAAGRNRDALERLDRLAKQVYFGEKHPDRIPEFVLWARGMAAARLRVDSVAIGDFQTLLNRALKREQQPQLVPVPLRTNEYRYILGAFHQRAADTARAAALLREAAEADLGLDMAHVRLAEIYRMRGDFGGEMQERQRAVAANPDDGTLQLELAMLRYEVGELEEAEEALRRAAALSPRDARPHYLLGVIAQMQGRPADARAAYERCVALAPARLTYLATDASTRLAALK
jgi:tetratricopeptide (TPR) repeat protein